jgi:hypothetical protein
MDTSSILSSCADVDGGTIERSWGGVNDAAKAMAAIRAAPP